MRLRPPIRAFTLVELLVVVAILGVLAALLVPGYKRTLDAANSSKCVSNLRQLSAGIAAYVSENNGSYPQNYETEAGHCWDVQIRNYVGVTSEEGITAASTAKGANVFFCPAGKPFTQTPNYLSRGYAYNQYVAKNQYGLGRVSGVAQPSKLGLLLEIYISLTWSPTYKESEQWYGGADYGNCEEINRSNVWTTVKPGLVYRHNKTMNVLFADGHVGQTIQNPASLFPKDVVWYWNNGNPVAD